MAGPLRVEHDVEVARWLQASLSDSGSVSANVAPIFDAYARILHPATLETPTATTDARDGVECASREITWAEAAALLGDRRGERQPWTAWLARFGEVREEHVVVAGHTRPDGGRILEPHDGDIPPPILSTLASLLLDEHGDDEVLVAVWEGSGLDMGSVSRFAPADETANPSLLAWRDRRDAEDPHIAALRASIDPEVVEAMRHGHVLGLPRDRQGRGHVLLRGRLSALVDPAWVETAGLGWLDSAWDGDGRTPNLLWPAVPVEAPAWMVATDLDLDVTLVGGSAHLIGRILGHPAIEAERVRATDPVI